MVSFCPVGGTQLAACPLRVAASARLGRASTSERAQVWKTVLFDILIPSQLLFGVTFGQGARQLKRFQPIDGRTHQCIRGDASN
jgi:hypothetical protein